MYQALKNLFEKRIIVGFGFSTDISQIEEHFLKHDHQIGKAFKAIKRFIDLQEVFSKVLKLNNPPSLQFVVQEAHKQTECFGITKSSQVTLCKLEQMSNWERRPLRESQIHYAAVDSLALNRITMNLANIEAFADIKIESFIKKIEIIKSDD